jgi:isoquinoline 1-oxidoreductase beta subunit
MEGCIYTRNSHLTLIIDFDFNNGGHEITASNRAINQSNFQDYPVPRISEVPYQTNVDIVDIDAPPAGVGEPGVPPFVAAFCNAVYAATGKRVRNLPITNYDLS